MDATSPDALAAAERRSFRALYQDGFDELRDGTVGLLAAVGLAAPAAYRLGLWPAVAVALFAVFRGFAIAKRRFIDRRTGFVRPASDNTLLPGGLHWWFAGGGALLALLLWVIESATRLSMPSYSEVLPYALFIVGFGWRARSTDLARYYLLAMVPLLAAVIAWSIEADSWDNLAILFAITGAASLLTGAFALRQYLLMHPSAPAN